MKVPRVEDFDPKAAPPLGSPMDNLPRIESPSAASPHPTVKPEVVLQHMVEQIAQDDEGNKAGHGPTEPVIEMPANPTLQIPAPMPTGQDGQSTERMKESKNVRFLTYIHSYLEAKADSVASFRYPQSIVDLLDDVVAQVWQRNRKKLTKSSVLVTAIAYLVWDFKEHGENSVLHRVLVNQRE